MNHVVRTAGPVAAEPCDEGVLLAYHDLSVEEIVEDEPVDGGRAALVALRESDPDSYRLVVYGWA